MTLLLTTALLSLALQGSSPADGPFPPSTALAEGVSPDALEALDDLVAGFVEDGEVVGAELLVIKNDRTILHAAYGWRDREDGQPMEPDSVFCVRSMTKPLVGTAIRMLVDEGLLDLGERVADHLPAFDVEDKRAITVEQLLTHTSGLPMSMILAADPRALESVRAVADLGGGAPLEFAPGEGFQYSDQGTDTLTALIEVVTGVPAEVFLSERVLAPLGMQDSTCTMTEEHRLRPRACSKYSGAPGSWQPFWSPDDAPLFGCFLGSQGLYATTTDYARFLRLWMDRGRVGGERLLRALSVRRALRPGPHPMRSSTGFSGLTPAYGSLMQLWTAADGDGEPEVVVFGHTGSDGTHAWAFPEQDAMVLYFTQSRGTSTGLRVEERLADLFLGVPFDSAALAPPFEDYLGYYWEGENDLYRAIVRDGDDLALEVLGRAVATLVYVGDDRWKIRDEPATVLAFDRDESGTVTGFHIGEHQELRFEPGPELPSAEELSERVAAAHHVERLSTLGVVRSRGSFSIERLGLQGEVVSWMQWPNRWRSDEVAGEERGRSAFDGEVLRTEVRGRPVAVLEGKPAELLRSADPFARLGDLSRLPHLEVIQRLGGGDDVAYLVRAGDASAPSATYYVDAETWLVRGVDHMTFAEGMGRIGEKARFDDHREVHGVVFPFRLTIELANPMIGPIVTTLDEVVVDVPAGEGLFALAD